MQTSFFLTQPTANLALWLRRTLFFALIFSLSYIQPKVVIFDVGNVLFTTSRWGMGREIGIWDLVVHKLTGGDIKGAGFKFLEDCFGLQAPLNSTESEENWTYTTGDGMRLPAIWCENMKGTISGEELIKKASTHIDDYFSSSRERRLIKNFLNSVFNPLVLAQHTYPIQEGADLIATCAAHPDTTVMILSNYAADAFDELYKKPESDVVFKHVAPEHIIVSANIGMLKPDPAIYEHVKTKLIALDGRFADPYFLSQNCVFIDDQIENIIGARRAGITALQLTDGDYTKLYNELKLLDVL